MRDERRAHACSSPASATSSSATTASASRWRTACAGRPMPDGVRVADFGIRGVHLAYELLDGYDALVLVDAVPMGEPPGTVAVIEPEVDDRARAATTPPLDAHSMNPAVVLGMLAGLGGSVGRVLLVGCEPAGRGGHRAVAAGRRGGRAGRRRASRCCRRSVRRRENGEEMSS